ncbi:ABC transporter ATP-binding protein [Lacticaseibacillus manihotivorans]|jgi:branched-chain amino acid transport system ATP-binding protein|uniref:ABC-type branched-chain amino acid transport system, ATPase component n=2 Tax=Lacticaseibacillus manihotivorans TaxID=88233 RepID=A0A0R1QD18_9LACO|nr:ABC transporter ATP-binding protein [Lacticaseibacillus manihotivorans]KRL42589.1 ABC-type branched-chain amino acid transport system, ATPase component [Lacticaseibacillus manihotivorans DSM 13343 = JCM 12514]QFQ92740.1 ATP-binding cassette domain-containing protein [Lacticaseibacillus manihotivorans]
MTTLLKVDHVSKIFGGLKAVEDVSMHVETGELVALIGPNGAGKTTLFNALTGVSPATEGTVAFRVGDEMVSLDKKKPYQVAKMGIARTFQNIRLFHQLSVRENLQAAMTHRYKEGFVSSILRLPAFAKQEALANKWTDEILAKLDLTDVADVITANLPYGTQRRIEIARAVATDPQLIFLDEPAAGMNPEETADLAHLIKRLQTEFGLTVVLIEHDMSLVMSLAERIYVLEHGKLIAEGTPSEIQHNDAVINAYLGGGVHA